jgi:hypothetical protein
MCAAVENDNVRSIRCHAWRFIEIARIGYRVQLRHQPKTCVALATLLQRNCKTSILKNR